MALAQSNLAPNPAIAKGLSINSSGGLVNSNKPIAPPTANSTIAGLLTSSLVKPSTPLKSITANSDGSVSTAYHTPPTDSPKTTAPTMSPYGGLAPSAGGAQLTGSQSSGEGSAFSGLNVANGKTPQQIAAETGQTQTSTTNPQTGAQTTGTQTPFNATTMPSSFGGLLGASLGQAQGYYNQQGGLTQQAQDVISKYAGLEGGLVNTPESGAIGGARLAQLESLKNSALADISGTQAKQAGYEQPLTSAYQTGINATRPELGAYGQAYYQPLQAGQGGASSGIQPNDPAYTSLQQYAQLAAAGEGSQIPSTWTSNPVLNAQINEMAKQINPNYDPLTTSLNTQTQANTNAQIGSTNSVAGAATQQAITRINGVSTNLSNFLSQWGLNQSNSPYVNKPMSAFVGSSDGAGAVASWNLINADLRAATSQLLNTPGITPTGFTQELQGFDPANLSPLEIQTYLQALDAAGQYQQHSYQSTANAAYGSNTAPNPVAPVQPYSGTQTSNTPPSLPLPANPAAAQAQNAPSLQKVIGGSLLEAWGGITNALSGFGGFLAEL